MRNPLRKALAVLSAGLGLLATTEIVGCSPAPMPTPTLPKAASVKELDRLTELTGSPDFSILEPPATGGRDWTAQVNGSSAFGRDVYVRFDPKPRRNQPPVTVVVDGLEKENYGNYKLWNTPKDPQGLVPGAQVAVNAIGSDGAVHSLTDPMASQLGSDTSPLTQPTRTVVALTNEVSSGSLIDANSPLFAGGIDPNKVCVVIGTLFERGPIEIGPLPSIDEVTVPSQIVQVATRGCELSIAP